MVHKYGKSKATPQSQEFWGLKKAWKLHFFAIFLNPSQLSLVLLFHLFTCFYVKELEEKLVSNFFFKRYHFLFSSNHLQNLRLLYFYIACIILAFIILDPACIFKTLANIWKCYASHQLNFHTDNWNEDITKISKWISVWEIE